MKWVLRKVVLGYLNGPIVLCQTYIRLDQLRRINTGVIPQKSEAQKSSQVLRHLWIRGRP